MYRIVLHHIIGYIDVAILFKYTHRRHTKNLRLKCFGDRLLSNRLVLAKITRKTYLSKLETLCLCGCVAVVWLSLCLLKTNIFCIIFFGGRPRKILDDKWRGPLSSVGLSHYKYVRNCGANYSIMNSLGRLPLVQS